MEMKLGHRKKKMVLFLSPMLQLQGRKTAISAVKRDDRNVSNSCPQDVRSLCKQRGLTEALHALYFMEQPSDSSAYVCLLQVCIQTKALSDGNLIHAHMNERGFVPDRFLWNTLVNMYAKCGSLVDARRVFDQMPARDVFSWTVMIAAYARHGLAEEALILFHQMQRTEIQPNQFTFASVLPACATLVALEQGMKIHEEIVRNGCQSDLFVANALVDMYGKCGSIEKARDVFDKMPQRDVVSWTAMIAAYAHNGYVDEALELFGKMPERSMVSWNVMIAGFTQNGHVEEALKLFREMPERDVVSWTVVIAGYVQNGHCMEALKLFRQMQLVGVKPDTKTFAIVLTACADLAALEHGVQIHEQIIRNGFQSNPFVVNGLVGMYAKFDSIEKARYLFDKMHQRDVVSWTAMIAGYALSGHVDEALKLFQTMPERNIVAWNAMIAGYTQHGHIDEALKLFEKMPVRDVVSWTSMISGYAQNAQSEDSLKLFRQMQLAGVKPNSKTIASVLPACGNLAALKQGMEIHAEIIRSGFQSDVFVESALVDMYAKCGNLQKARNIFDKIHIRDMVAWTAMIVGYAQNGSVDESLKLFHKMPEQNMISWNAMMAGCAQNGCVDKALELFQKMPDRNVVSWNTMMIGYAQNGHVDKAVKVFQEMPERNIVSWTVMIAGYAQNGHNEEALKFFQQMQLAGVKPDSKTFASVLPACANLAALEQGIEIHNEIIRNGFETDIFLLNALVDMYAKCGIIQKARDLFDRMHQRNTYSWTSIIAGYALHGCGKEALKLFEQMEKSGITPDQVTFVCVLSACCHAGLVDEGWHYFHRMSQYYHIMPAMEHYGCMVDLLGRAGRLNEALDFIYKMPIKPDATVWGCLLGACRIHNCIELGERVADHFLELDRKNSAPYVLLSNMYAAAGRWNDIEMVRKKMKDRKVKKTPGCSWIEVNKQVHSFRIGESAYLQM
eukprot:Gb_38500 [translate_table: standard]